jgi:hypothetical protein
LHSSSHSGTVIFAAASIPGVSATAGVLILVLVVTSPITAGAAANISLRPRCKVPNAFVTIRNVSMYQREMNMMKLTMSTADR